MENEQQKPKVIRAKKEYKPKARAESHAVVAALIKHKGNQASAAKSVGISRQSIQRRLKTDPLVKSEWQRFLKSLERAGATNYKAAKVISEAMGAEKEHRNMSGQVVDTTPDHQTRLKATEQYLKIKRILGEDADQEGDKHIHFHFGDKKTEELLSEIKGQLSYLETETGEKA